MGLLCKACEAQNEKEKKKRKERVKPVTWADLAWKSKLLKYWESLCPSRHCSGPGINLVLCALDNLTPAWSHICAWSVLNLVSRVSHWCSDASPWLSTDTTLRRQPFKPPSPAPPHKCQPKEVMRAEHNCSNFHPTWLASPQFDWQLSYRLMAATEFLLLWQE